MTGVNRHGTGDDDLMTWTRSLLLVALALSGLLGPATPASAHAVLSESQPGAGATVTEPVPNVRLEFSEVVRFAQVRVVSPSGEDVTDGPTLEVGDVVEQPLVALVETGEYAVAYRATSEDDHPIEGTFTFDYQGPVETVEAETEASPATPRTTDPEATDGEQAPTPTEEARAADGADGPGWLLPALLLLAVLAVGGGAVMALRGRSDASG
jgi:copper resistance protein C